MKKFIVAFNIVVWAINIVWFSMWLYEKPERDRAAREFAHVNKLVAQKHADPNQLHIDFRLQSMYNRFNKDYCKHLKGDLNTDYLDEIVVGDLYNGEWGVCSQYKCNEGHMHARIVIDPKILEDTVGSQFVFYHEMGHFMGRQHTFCDTRIIMHHQYSKETKNFISDSTTEGYSSFEDAKLLFFRWKEVEEKFCMCYEQNI